MAIGAAITDDQIQTFLNALPHASLLLDSHGTILTANDVALRFRADCVGRALADLALDESSAEKIRGFFLEGGPQERLPATLTHQFFSAGGERKLAAWALKTLPGTLEPRILASVQAISSVPTEDDDFPITNEILRTTVDYSTKGLILLDPSFRIRYCNPATHRLFGYQIEQLLKQPAELLLAPEEREYWQGLRGVLESAPSDFLITREMDFLRSDGTVFPAELTVTVLLHHATRAIMLRVRDLVVVRQTDARLRQLSRAVENSPTSIVITDAEGLIEYVNPKFEELTGYTLEEARGQTPRILSSGDKTREEYEALWQTIKSGRVWRGEFLNKRKSGELYWELASISPIFDERGRISNFVAVKEDISQRKALEQRLRQLSQAVENSPVSIVITDAQGLVEYVNPRFVELTGYSVEDVHGKLLRALRPGSLPEEELKTLWQALHAGQAWRGEFLNKRKDGSFYWELASISPLLNERGELINLIAVREDISERKLMEQRLRLSKARYRSVVDSQSEMVWRFTPGFVITFVNETLCHYLNRRPEELLMASVFDVLPADQHEQVRRFMGLLTPEEPAREWEIPVVTGHGERRWHVWRDLALFDENGRVVEYQSVGRDVTERKRVEEALRQVNQRLEMHLKQTPLAVIEHDMDFRILRWNPAAEQIFGYSEAEMLGQEAWLLLSDDVRPSVEALKEEIYSSGQSRKSINQNVRKDGRVITCEWYNTPLVNEDGKVIGAVSMAQDVTERKQAEDALRLANQRLELHLEQTPLGVIEQDANFVITRWNPAAEKIFGYSAEEAIGQQDTLVWAPHLLERAEEMRQKLRSQRGPQRNTGESVRKDGQLITCEWYNTPLVDESGEIIGFASLMMDVTDRLKMEEQLRLGEERYRSVVNAQLEMVWRFDPDFRITFVNDALCRYLGRSAEELLHQTVFDAIPDTDHQRMREHIAHLTPEAPVQVWEYIVTNRFGEERWHQWSDQALFDAGGQVVEYQSVGQDITDRKRAEEALRLANQRLALHVTNTPLAVIEYDVDFNIIGWNHAAEQIFGYSAEEAIGQTDLLVWMPERAHLAEGIRSKLRTQRGNERGSGQTYRKDGRLIYCDWFNTALVNEANEIIGFASLALDVTERKLAEDALRQANQRLALHITHTPLAVIEYDADFRIIGWNQAAERIFGFSAEEAIGQDDYFLWMPEEREVADHMHQRLLTTGLSERGVGETRRKDGEIIVCEWYNTPLVDANGVVIGVASLALDVTERVRAEEALRQANQRLALHLEQTPMAVIEWDLDFRVTRWNPAAERVFGHSEAEALGQHASFILPPHLHEFGEEVKRDIYQRQRGQRNTNENLRKDGQIILCEWYNTPLVDDSGKIIGAASLALDVTERKQAEEALAESEARYRAIVQDQTEFVTRFDAQGKLTFANEALLKYLQCSTEDIERLAVSEFVYAEDLPAVMASIASLTPENPVASVEQRIYRGDGALRWHLWTNHALFDEAGNLTGYQGVGRDITEEKELSEAIRKSEANLRSILDHTRVAYLLFDLEGRLVMVNPAAIESARTFLNMELTEGVMVSELLSGDLQADFRKNFARALNDQSTRSEMYVDMPDGKRRWFELHYQPIRIENGAILGAFVSIDEITERRDAEKRRLALELEHKHVEIISNFVRDASHEFRNPLTMINTAAGLMSRSDDPARRAQKAQQVESQIQRITRLLDDLLMMAELDGSPRMNLTAIDPNLALRMLSLRIADRAKARQQTVITALAQDLPLIQGDLQWLNEALLRVADNSLRYCPEGATIRIESRRSGEEVVLSICDNGAGIPLETVPQIFDRFYRAGRSPTEAGFGLGLAIVRRIVELHGGRAEVETHPGEGICFHLIFPVVGQEAQERRRN